MSVLHVRLIIPRLLEHGVQEAYRTFVSALGPT